MTATDGTNPPKHDDTADPGPGLMVGTKLELPLVFLGGVLVAAAWISTIAHAEEWVMWTLCLASAPLTSLRTFRRAIAAVASFKVDIDVLMFVAAFGAAAIGKPIEGAFLLFLFGVGAVSEFLAMRRAENALSGLQALAPENAERLIQDGSVEIIELHAIAPGDLIRVRPFARIPCDGVIVEGTTSIDESTLTGESIPIDKDPGDEVLAGTLNTTNAITIRATRPAAESALARVIKVVTEARTRRARVEMLTERIEKWYAPGVLVAAGVVFAVPTIIWGDGALWFYRSMAFLTAASPCALAIGAPATYLCGIAAGARRGIVFKGGESIEALAKARTFALDKTGTITTGKPAVRDVVAMEGTEAELLAVAAAVEAQASHPLADAIVAEARTRGLELDSVTEVEQISGLGVRGCVKDRGVLIASPSILKDQPGADRARKIVHELSAAGDSVIVVEVEGQVLGLIGVRDTVRPDAAEAIANLTARGFRVIMLTGDHAEAAAVIADEVGITEVFAGQKPEDKLKVIEDLSAEDGPVAMIGDGVNDAPALARASVSLSMGGAASDVAAENADIAIMGERLSSVVEAVTIARFGSRLMRQNLIIALAVILIVAPLAIAGVADLAIAVIFHEGSTVVVVVNALRQLHRPGHTARA